MNDDNNLNNIYLEDDDEESQDLVLTGREEDFITSAYEFILEIKTKTGTLQGSEEHIWGWVDSWYKFMLRLEEEGDEPFDYEKVKSIIEDYMNGLESLTPPC